MPFATVPLRKRQFRNGLVKWHGKVAVGHTGLCKWAVWRGTLPLLQDLWAALCALRPIRGVIRRPVATEAG